MPRKGYSFRDVTETDLPMLRGWLEQPHMRQWWDDPDTEIAAIAGHMDSVSVEPLIAELDGRPIGYAQWYDPHLEDDHPYGDQPFGTLGIDLSIGEADMLGQGHGSALLRALADELIEEGAPRLVIDPHPDNRRAIRAYEKAGFRHFDTRNSIYGPAFMMALDAPEETD
ncbi:MAG: GNAT family N-acetyltransferase [Mesorhizobium sp.]